ncbi:hypothetical protein G7054_g12251 [Neopestalotiopsis clavispora]|nr:hypothetical protein G7054_g12251 [Neopestalotiopsis clavispora]
MPKPLSDRALIDKEIRFVQKRLQHCVAICDHNNERDGFLPRRLLYVYHEKLRIVEFNDEHVAKRDTRYVTLSYCWGAPVEAASQVKLTDQNAVHLKSGFSIEELSPIQKDAVHATRILGVPFVWIDALCIRQDSRSDWERESSVMDRIYANSYLTICTLTSASCQEGFLQRPEYPRRIKIPYDMTRDDSECFEIGHAAVYDSDSDWTESDIENNRWNTRGWTFQEKLLATRILYFGNTGLHFACSTRLCSEFSDFDEKPRSLVLDAILKIQDSKSIYHSWYSHVAQKFSARQLTYIGDTLPALSGLARRFAEATNDRYLAGLWRKDLVHGLLWTLRRPEFNSLLDLVESLKEKQNYVGPSWTWAGRGALSSFLRGKRDLLSRSHSLQVSHLQCKVMRASTTPNGQDSFGTVSGGILILEAYICPLRLAGFSWKTQESPWRPHMGDFWIHKPNEKGVFFFCNLDWNPLEEVQWPGELTMALIGSIEDSGSHRGSNISRPSGLLLYKTGTPEQYVRVGLFGPSIRKARKQDRPLHLGFFHNFESKIITIV